MPVTTAQFQLLDLQLGGELEQVMRTLYAETNSWDAVARRLLVDHGREVTGETLRRWSKVLGIGAASTDSATDEAVA